MAQEMTNRGSSSAERAASVASQPDCSAAQHSAGLKPSEVLDRAAALIEPEGAWIQHEYALDALGNRLQTNELAFATCFCAEGAICRIARKTADVMWDSAEFDWLRKAIEFADIPAWNDAKGRTQSEVVDALKRAAELARSEGQ